MSFGELFGKPEVAAIRD